MSMHTSMRPHGCTFPARMSIHMRVRAHACVCAQDLGKVYSSVDYPGAKHSMNGEQVPIDLCMGMHTYSHTTRRPTCPSTFPSTCPFAYQFSHAARNR